MSALGYVRGGGPLSRICPRCGAAIGWRCTKTVGDRILFINVPHAERKTKRRKASDQVIQGDHGEAGSPPNRPPEPEPWPLGD